MSYWFSFVFPWLLGLWLLQILVLRFRREKGSPESPPPGRPWFVFLFLGFAAGVIVLLPFRGIALGRWMAGLNLFPSIPLLGLMCGQIWRTFFGTELFRPQDKQAVWIFGGLVGTVLYPLSLGLGNFDPYARGWSFSFLFPAIILTTLFLLWKQNRFGLLLFLCILAYDLRCLESSNFWDYLLDPVYWLLSLTLLARRAFRRLNPRFARAP